MQYIKLILIYIIIKMENSIGRTKKLQKLHNIPNHWFKDTLNEEDNYNFDKLGIHHKSCNGTNIEDDKYVVVCCGKTYCYLCDTVMHGCTDNECFYSGNDLIKCHTFCSKAAKKKAKIKMDGHH